MDNQTITHRHGKPGWHWRGLLWLVLISLLLTGLAWFAYQQRVVLFTDAANVVLQPFGYHIDTLADLHVNATSLRIGQLTLLHSESNAPQTLHNIRIDYTPAGLVNGQLNVVSIATAQLTLPDSPPPSPGAPDPASPPLSVSDMLAANPVSRLHIGHLQVSAHELTIGAARIQNLSADFSSLQMSCQSSRCRITSQLGFTVDSLDYRTDEGVTELDLIAFRSHESIGLTAEANTNTLSLDARSSMLTLPAIRADDTLTGLILDLHRLNATQTLSPEGFDPARLNAHAEMSVSEVYTNLVDLNLWSMRLDQHLSWQQGTWVVTGAMARNNQRLLLNELRHDTALNTGQGTLQIPRLNFDNSSNKLSDLISPLPWQADVVSGSASATARINWLINNNNQLVATGDVQVILDDISGYVNEIAFLRLSTDFAADLLPDWGLRSSRAAAITAASLDAGIELNNLRSDYRVNSVTGSIALANASFDIFGGTVSSEQLEYRLQDNDSHFTIVIDSIDLNRVLGMNAYRGVSATGLVSGQLPVRLQGLSPSIRGGTLSALHPGGAIRYGTGASGAANLSVRDQSLDLVYQALEHYRFNLMETTVDYQESGELDLTIRMEGVSPGLNGGQRINLNLTINDDIPALLQSLQAARTVTDTIQARLDARQE